MKFLSLMLILAVAASSVSMTRAAEPATSPLDFQVKSITGKKVNLADEYDGKVVLIVNVASECGATPQYESLQALYEKYQDQDFVILGFPCNQFGKQEPGTEAEIREFCTSNYGVTFDMFSKIDVNGPNASPVYEFLTSKKSNPNSPGRVRWNFEKFLIGRDGQILHRFRTPVQPESTQVITAIESALKE